jgi:hypothetical protein
MFWLNEYPTEFTVKCHFRFGSQGELAEIGGLDSFKGELQVFRLTLVERAIEYNRLYSGHIR